MQFDAHCIDCLVHRQYRLAMAQGDGKKADEYLRDVLKIILEAPKGVSAAWLSGAFAGLFQRYWPGRNAYAQLKQQSNDLVLGLLPKIRPIIETAQEPLEMALKFACTGNFLDFGVLTLDTALEHLDRAIAETPALQLSVPVWKQLRGELSQSKELLILGDNAGEIVFDTLFVRQLQKAFPALHITYCVRGGDVLNDVTYEDAAISGMDRLCTVIDSGEVVSGTELQFVGDTLKKAVSRADVIIAKGSGNFESLAGCGLNAYYVFMCKCQRVAKLLGTQNLTHQLIRERSLPKPDPYVGPIE